MKKLLLNTVLLVSSIISLSSANAQGVAFNRGMSAHANPYPEAENKIVNEIDVKIDAVRDFRKTYKKATNVKWVQNDNGASVYFLNDGVRMRTSYNPKGKREYTLKYYDETKMPVELRQRVRSNYYDHNIMIVTEVIRNNQTSYLVKMENAKEFLTVRISDDEMSVFERTNKIR